MNAPSLWRQEFDRELDRRGINVARLDSVFDKYYAKVWHLPAVEAAAEFARLCDRGHIRVEGTG